MQEYKEADINFEKETYPYFNIKHFGTQKCLPNHYYGPAMRSYYLIHYILNGKGRFIINQNEYHIGAGSGFFIPPNEVVYYQADKDSPWEYVWVGFEGRHCERYFNQANITLQNPVFNDNSEYTKDLFRQISDCAYAQIPAINIRVTGLVMLFFSQILLQQAQKSDIKVRSAEMHVNKAIEYIKNNYWRRITIPEIADYVNINRTYLCKIFKNYMGISPSQYILNLKMEYAKEFLKNPKLRVSDVARSVGYEDLFTFSKAYKRVMGVSPSADKLG